MFSGITNTLSYFRRCLLVLIACQDQMAALIRRSAPAERAPVRRATPKRTGERCKCPAVTGWSVCRAHGAGGRAPRAPAHVNYRHGMRSRDTVQVRRLASYLSRAFREYEYANLPCRMSDLHGLVRMSAMRKKLPLRNTKIIAKHNDKLPSFWPAK